VSMSEHDTTDRLQRDMPELGKTLYELLGEYQDDIVNVMGEEQLHLLELDREAASEKYALLNATRRAVAIVFNFEDLE
jgi:hypothetical protein